jgi:hypothetical protein
MDIARRDGSEALSRKRDTLWRRSRGSLLADQRLTKPDVPEWAAPSHYMGTRGLPDVSLISVAHIFSTSATTLSGMGT